VPFNLPLPAAGGGVVNELLFNGEASLIEQGV